MLSARHVAALVVLGSTSLGLLLSPTAARADDAAVVSCTLSGSTLPAIDTVIYEKSDGSSAVAKLTGGKIGITVSDFFAGGGDRVRVKTGAGSGFRIDGWIDASKLSVFTSKDVPVVQSHIFIAAQREVALVAAGSGKLRVKRQVGSPFGQAFTGWAPCGSLSLSATTASGWTPAGSARGYVAKKDVELFDSGDEGRSMISMLSPDSSSDGVLLWSTEKKGGWVHLEHHSDVVIDAWARASDLHALKRGETQDAQPGATTKRNPPTLKLGGNASLKTAPKDLTIRASGSDKGKAIGTLESGAEVYVLDTVAGWSSVLPKALNVTPHGEDGQFWVKAKELNASP
jgi:hypothetical protein